MSKVLVTGSHLEDIADAIREQNGTGNTYKPGQMAAAIRALEGLEGGESVDISGKADKVSNATSGNFAALDSNGNLIDSGHKHGDYLTSHQDITGKADKPISATSGNLAMFDGSRNPVDSGIVASSMTPPVWEYDGVDLSTKFASEISSYTNVWAWLQARLTNHDLKGIHVKDYISVTCTNGYTFDAQVAGINPYLDFGDTELTTWHIDFVSRELWPDAHVWNKVDYNNGLSGSGKQYPWTCCDVYHFINSLSGNVPNGTTVNPSTVSVNYSSTGVFDKLPTALKNVIVEKSANTGGRYSANGLLTDDNTYGTKNLGKLWVPTEMEVYGCSVWGTRGYSQGDGVQYPLFRDQKMRIKRTSGGARSDWWLLNPSSGYSTDICRVTATGIANRYNASATWLRVPVCFRIAGSVS